MRVPDRPSAFTSDSARDKYHAAYDRLLGELWPVPIDAFDVETRAGSVRIHRAGPATGDEGPAQPSRDSERPQPNPPGP